MILALAAALPVWALVCLAVYAALRWAQARLPGTVTVVGFLVFSVQFVVVSYLLMCAFGGFTGLVMLGVLTLWLTTILGGANLVQVAKQQR